MGGTSRVNRSLDQTIKCVEIKAVHPSVMILACSIELKVESVSDSNLKV